MTVFIVRGGDVYRTGLVIIHSFAIHSLIAILHIAIAVIIQSLDPTRLSQSLFIPLIARYPLA